MEMIAKRWRRESKRIVILTKCVVGSNTTKVLSYHLRHRTATSTGTIGSASGIGRARLLCRAVRFCSPVCRTKRSAVPAVARHLPELTSFGPAYRNPRQHQSSSGYPRRDWNRIVFLPTLRCMPSVGELEVHTCWSDLNAARKFRDVGHCLSAMPNSICGG